MSDIFFNKNKTCAVTGHRVVDKKFNESELKNVFVKLIENKYDTFLIGMALGFDTLCFNILLSLKEKCDIKIIACIPCEKQDLKFNLSQKKEYDRLLNLADEKVFVSQKYTSRCMQKRNEYMVDNSTVIVAYLRRNFGGTFNTVEYAKKAGVPVISV